MKLHGQLIQGYRVDSGLSTRDMRFPQGTLRTQEPFFAALGFSFEEYFGGRHVWGSLNMDLQTLAYRQKESHWFLKNVNWTPLQPAENFFITRCSVMFGSNTYKAVWYNPDPATKPNHFQYPTVIQFIAERIPDIKYGDVFDAEVPDECIETWSHDGQRPEDPNLKPWL